MDIKDTRNTKKEGKLINGKRIHIILDIKNYQILKDSAREHQLTMTKFLEKLLKEKENNNTDNISKIFALTNLNEKLYLDINATFNNINQIAYQLNLDKFLNESKINNDFLNNTLLQLQENNKEIQDFRLLILEFLLTLEIDYKKQKAIQTKIKKYQEIYQKNPPFDYKLNIKDQ